MLRFAMLCLSLSALLLAESAAAAPKGTLATLDGRVLSPAAIDATARRLMRANDVKGLAIALIRDGDVRFERAYGLRDVEHDLPLRTDTIMYGASLTKATFAYFVMQLVDEKRIDLDRPIERYLPKPLAAYEDYADLAGDARRHALTMRMLLDHTPGFSNFRFLTQEGGYVPDGKLTFHFDPGARFAYSGEGILLAQRVIERGLGLDVGAEMQRRLFDRFGMKRTSMIWREGFAGNLAEGYAIDGKRLAHDKREHVRAPGSMDTTPHDWARFLAAVVRGEGLSRAANAEMIKRQITIRSESEFPTLGTKTTHDYDAIRLGYGLGWGVFETPFGHAFFKEGHDDGTANYALCVEPRRACVLLMSNSVRAEGIFKALVDATMGETHLPWRWEGYVPYDATDARPHGGAPGGL